MKKFILYSTLFIAGFLAKVTIAEVRHFRNVQLLDRYDISESLTRAEKSDVPLKILTALNYQPEVWMFLGDRCVDQTDRGNGITNAQYFGCTWQLTVLKILNRGK